MRSPRIPQERTAVFFCEHDSKDRTGAACLRMQTERAKVQHPRTFAIVEGGFIYGHCASSCEQGREIRAALQPLKFGPEAVAIQGVDFSQPAPIGPKVTPPEPEAAVVPAPAAGPAVVAEAGQQSVAPAPPACSRDAVPEQPVSGGTVEVPVAELDEAAPKRPGDPVHLKPKVVPTTKARRSLYQRPLEPGFACSFCTQKLATRRMDDGRRICRYCYANARDGGQLKPLAPVKTVVEAEAEARRASMSPDALLDALLRTDLRGLDAVRLGSLLESIELELARQLNEAEKEHQERNAAALDAEARVRRIQEVLARAGLPDPLQRSA